MRKLIFGLMILFGIFTITHKSAAQAQPQLRLGVVDVQVIVTGLPEATEADKKLKDLTQKYRDSLLGIQKEYNARREQYEKQKALMTPDKQKEAEDQLKSIETQYMQFQEEKLGVQGELASLREKLLEPIREKVKKSIEEIAKEEKMSFVFDKTNASLLFSEDKFDITYKVLDRLKRGTK
jgi:outer membrane protein